MWLLQSSSQAVTVFPWKVHVEYLDNSSMEIILQKWNYKTFISPLHSYNHYVHIEAPLQKDDITFNFLGFLLAFNSPLSQRKCIYFTCRLLFIFSY